MSKLKVLVAVLAVVTLLLVPTAAFAVGVPPVAFIGTAYLGAVPVAEGTVVTAWIEGVEAGRDETDAAGAFYLMVDVSGHADTVISFEVAGHPVVETFPLTHWRDLMGTGPHHVDLHAVMVAPEPVGLILTPEIGLATTVSGIGFTPYSEITLTWDDDEIITIPKRVTADIHGTFIAMLVAPTITPGGYMIGATDAVGRSAQAAFTVPDLRGPEGPEGPEGPP
ncbi:hypothetical protein M1N85_05195, partial [Dehalococcoidia bacterium]|nr:hypothetical protein [Dehalococcoidia bacterium]